MPVHVIIKRKMRVYQPEKLLPLLSELRVRASKQPGYIGSETLRNTNSHEEYMVISIWQTADDWNNWVQSKERRELQGRVDSLIGERTFYEIFDTVRH